MTTPIITTDRLLLREFRATDFPAYVANLADPEAQKFLLSAAVDSRTAWRMFTSGTGQWSITGSGWWFIEGRADGALIGTVGAFFRETQLATLATDDFELGWAIFRDHWRRGYATEAAAAARDYGFATFKRGAFAYVDGRNVASIGVAKRIGMTYAGERPFYGEASQVYTIQRR